MSQLIYGRHALVEALKAGRRKFNHIYTSKDGLDKELERLVALKKIPVKLVDVAELTKLAQGPHHQGVVADVAPFPYASLEEALLKCDETAVIAACDGMTDPQNFGSICRAARCFGVKVILLPKDHSVEVTPAVVKASSGAVEGLLVVKVTNLSRTLNQLKDNGFWIYGAFPQGETTLKGFEPASKAVIVLGSEGKGIRPGVANHCDVRLRIPMQEGFDSLNIAQAGTILFHAFFQYFSA